MRIFRFPWRCVFCTLPAGRERICPRCLGILPWNDRHCPRCGQPLAARGDAPCADCQRKPPVFDRARAPLLYAFPVDAALKKLKFHGQTMYAPALAKLLLPVLERDFADCDVLVPVPLHRWRHALRGFNQATELSKALSGLAGLPICSGPRRGRRTRPQSGLSAAERRRNLTGAFTVGPRYRYRYPLIVDDVITTGETCSALASALFGAGAREVGALAVAHAARAGAA